MNSLVKNLKPLFSNEGIKFREHENSLFTSLTNSFGELQVSDLENNDDIVGLVGSDWHTHSECLGDPDIAAEEKVLEMVKNIFSGKLLLPVVNHWRPVHGALRFANYCCSTGFPYRSHTGNRSDSPGH